MPSPQLFDRLVQRGIFIPQVLSVLDDTLGNENPTLYQAVEELWRRHIYVLYPFQPKYSNRELWAAALQLSTFTNKKFLLCL